MSEYTKKVIEIGKYGKNNFYLAHITEDGKIVSIEKGSY